MPQPISLFPSRAGVEEQLSMLPESGGVYRLAISGGSAHLAWTANLSRRVRRLVFPRGVAPAELRLRLERIECWQTSSKLESSLLMYGLARELFPEDYTRRLRLRLPWFLGINSSDGFARLVAVNGKGRQDLMWGPFSSREAAECYQEEVLRLYSIRRCTERLRPSPEHPGCIYGEMKLCVRPCQGAVSRGEYEAEFGRVTEFLRSNGRAVLSGLSAARAAASEKEEFEEAAQIHRRMEQVKAAMAAREEVVDELRSLHGVAVTKGHSAREVRLWPMLAGCWQEPITLDVSAEQTRSKSMDADLKERLTAVFESDAAPGDAFEHLAVFLRWYRSSWRDGAWIGFSSLASLNYRRLVREISKLAKEGD